MASHVGKLVDEDFISDNNGPLNTVTGALLAPTGQKHYKFKIDKFNFTPRRFSEQQIRRLGGLEKHKLILFYPVENTTSRRFAITFCFTLWLHQMGKVCLGNGVYFSIFDQFLLRLISIELIFQQF